MTKQDLQNIFRQPFNAEVWQGLLINLFGVTEIRHTPAELETDNKKVAKGELLGELNTSDRYAIGLFAFEVNESTKIEMNRVGLRSLVKSYTRYEYDAAITVYYNETHWRLSFICDLKGENTAPKRYTYVFGNSEDSYRTAADRLMKLADTKPTFESLKDAFSVEKLSKEFFDGYKLRYKQFCEDINCNSKRQRDYVKKMMGRLVFLQFLQKKGWMNGDYNYLQNLYANSTHQDTFLDDVLEPLFFHVLNTKVENRNIELLKNVGDTANIPYLNGGLFEPTNNEEYENAVFDKKLFASLFDFFAAFNFTIDENDPNDAVMGIDPEMLGHIFENLLEDNSEKGAFYTPKEIVQYMCRQSLIEYLKSKTQNEWHPYIELLVSNHKIAEAIQGDSNFAERINTLLVDVKVCDPAIGSGAFPMGLLNEIFALRKKIYPELQGTTKFVDADVKREIIQNNIYGVDIEQGAVDIARLRFWLSLVVDEKEAEPLPNLDFKIVCGNSLLNRFELDSSLENAFLEYNKDKAEGDKITLARLKEYDSNYTVQSDKGEKSRLKSIIDDVKSNFKTVLSANLMYFTKKEKKWADKYFNYINSKKVDSLFGDFTYDEKQLSATEKKELEKIRKVIADKAAEVSNINNNKLYLDAFEWRFEFPALLGESGEFKGFDIVIGNPPYLRIQGIRDASPAVADELSKKYDSATGAFDLYALFVERGLEIIAEDGVVNYIMPVKWTNAAFGKGLRKVIAEKNSANKIIAFGAYQVFNASTYTGLQWFKPNSEALQYCELDQNLYTNQALGNYLSSLDSESFARVPAEKLDDKAWVLTVGETTKILNRLEQHPRRINDIFEKIFQGLATSKDDVYFLYGCVDTYETSIKGYSKHLGRIVEIEKGLVKPLLKGDGVHRYDNISTENYVIFPYKLEDGKANLYSEAEIEELFPMGYEYLKECEDELRGRERGRLINDDYWFRYIYPKNLVLFANEKLVAPEISLGGNYAYDKKGEFYSTTKIYGYIKKEGVKESYKFWMALFNSRVFWYFMQNTGYVLRGGYYTFKTNYINPFPVPAAEVIEDVEVLIERLVDYMVYLYDKQNEDIISHTPNRRIRAHIDDILNMAIYELYFGEHMREVGIDVIADLRKYNFSDTVDAKSIEDFYLWYQTSENLIRQKMMILDTRSRDLIYEINLSKIYEQDK